MTSQLVVCCCLWSVNFPFVTLQFSVQFYFQVLLIDSFNFNSSSQYVLLAVTSCNTSNITYYTVILCHKVVFLVLAGLIVMKIFNRIAAVVVTMKIHSCSRHHPLVACAMCSCVNTMTDGEVHNWHQTFHTICPAQLLLINLPSHRHLLLPVKHNQWKCTSVQCA